MAGKTVQPAERWGRHTEIPQEQEMGEKEAGGEEGGWKGREQEQGQTREKRGKTHQAEEESP